MERRPAKATGRARHALSTACAVVLALGCARGHSVNAPGPIDEIPALNSALAASGFAGGGLYPSGTVILSRPGPPGDMRAYAFRHAYERRDSFNSWTLSEPGADGRPLRAECQMCWYVKSNFYLFVTDASGTQIGVRKPDGNDDFDRKYIFRRASSGSPWLLDSLTAAVMLSDDKLSCDSCRTTILSLRFSASGLVMTLNEASIESYRPPGSLLALSPGTPLHVEVHTLLAEDAVFVYNGGEWTRLAPAGARSFAGDVMPHEGLTTLAVQALTDSSLVAIGRHYAQSTWIVEYKGVGVGPEVRSSAGAADAPSRR